MIKLFGVVIESSVVAGAADVAGLGQLITCEKIGKDEACELEFVVIMSEHTLVEEEVSPEEEQQGLDVHNFGVDCVADQPRFLVDLHLELDYQIYNYN